MCPCNGDRWAVAPVKNSNTSNIGEIWTVYVNLTKINNRSDQNNVASHVGELWGVTAPELPTPKFKYSDFGEIWTIYVNLHLESNELVKILYMIP